MGQGIPADMMAVGREDSKPDCAGTKQRFAGLHDGGLRALNVAMEDIEPGYSMFAQRRGDR
jgi:hypothetical protein